MALFCRSACSGHPHSSVQRALVRGIGELFVRQQSRPALLVQGAAMDALPLRVTPRAGLEEAVFFKLSSLLKHQATEPVKVKLAGSTAPDSSEDELESTTGGTLTPKTQTQPPSVAPEPSSPAFVPQEALEAVAGVPALAHASETPTSLDSVPAFIPEDPALLSQFAMGLYAEPQPPEGGHFGKMLSVHNVPRWYSPDIMLEEVRDAGFCAHKDFDLFHMPQDRASGLNLGVCVIRFLDEGAANAFDACFQLRTARLAEQEPPFEVALATGKDFEKAPSHCTASDAPPQKDRSMTLRSGYPRQARFCPQCGSGADCSKFNFCSQCGASIAHLRQTRA
uniref:Uncharacterized protein n=1 Tax=Alexandrium catenella TaxID=2925 RepID=A0A7S1Q3T1_ALECA